MKWPRASKENIWQQFDEDADVIIETSARGGPYKKNRRAEGSEATSQEGRRRKQQKEHSFFTSETSLGRSLSPCARLRSTGRGGGRGQSGELPS